MGSKKYLKTTKANTTLHGLDDGVLENIKLKREYNPFVGILKLSVKEKANWSQSKNVMLSLKFANEEPMVT